jgi:hypothetical protein
MTQVIVTDLVTGRNILNVPFTAASWKKARNSADTLSCTVPMSSRAVRKLDLWNATTPAKTIMAAVENDVVMAMGEIWSRRWSEDGNQLTLNASRSLFKHRTVLPPMADIDDVIDPVSGDTAAAFGTDLVGMTYGQMVKTLAMQALGWAGGSLPIVFEADEVGGAYEKHWKAANLSILDTEITDFTNLVNGIDIDFFGRRTSDKLGVEWLLRTGKLGAEEIHGLTVHRWDLSVPKPSARNLTVSDDASTMTGQAWVAGGRQDGTAVVQRATNHNLTGVGYPLLESVDSSHPDASDPTTLMDYAQQDVDLGAAPANTWTFQARATSNPRVGSYWPGDYCDIVIPRGHPWINRAGAHRREIASISGDQDGKWVTVETEETIDA